MLKCLARGTRIALFAVILVGAALVWFLQALIANADQNCQVGEVDLVFDSLLGGLAVTILLAWSTTLVKKVLELQPVLSFTSVGPHDDAVGRVARIPRKQRRARTPMSRDAFWNAYRWSLLMATVLMFAVFLAVNLYPFEKFQGLWISMVGSRIAVNAPSIQAEGVVIHLRRGEKPKSMEISIDSSPISTESLEKSLVSALRDKLKKRPGAFVYIDGDADLDFREVAGVIDVAQGLSARVVLLPAKQQERGHHR